MSQATMIAKTVIHRTIKPGKPADKAAGTPPVKPEIQIIRSGARFKADNSAKLPSGKTECEELEALGAAVRSSDTEAVAEAKVRAEPPPEKPKDEEPKVVDFSKMTGKALDKYVKDNSITVPDNWPKMLVSDKQTFLASPAKAEDADADDDADDDDSGEELI